MVKSKEKIHQLTNNPAIVMSDYKPAIAMPPIPACEEELGADIATPPGPTLSKQKYDDEVYG